MSDSTEGRSLPRRTPSHFRLRCKRAWGDSKHILLGKTWPGIVTSIFVAVASFAIQSYAGRAIDVDVVVFSVVVGVMAGVGGHVAFFLLHLFFSYLAAPSRIYRDNQKRIVGLESQLERRLKLDVNVPLVHSVNTENFPTLHRLGKGGLVILLENLRLTNRSKTSRVSLSVTLRVRMDDFLKYRDDIESPDYLVVHSYKEFHDGVPPGNCFFSPIDIAPESSVYGDMCFPIVAVIRNAHEENKLVNYHSCLLDIIDHISGEGVTKDIDQRFLESPTARLVKRK